MAKIKIVSTPTMQFGGRLPGTGTNINSNIPNYNIDPRWYPYQNGSPYAYAPDPYQTKRALPEVPEEDADIVIEKKESVLGDFDGDGKQELMLGNSGTHASGNDQPVSVPDNSFVFSDTQALKIKDKDILKQFGKSKPSTPAQLANQYNLQKFLPNPQDDKMTAKTKEMMYNNQMGKLSQIAAVQEEMKEGMQIKKQMKMGGYTNGGPTLPYYGYNSVAQNQADMVSQKPQAAWFANMMGTPSAGTLVDDQQGYRTQFLNAAQNTQEPPTWSPSTENITAIPATGMTHEPEPMNKVASLPLVSSIDDVSKSGSGKKKVRIAGLPGMNPDTLGDFSLALKAGSLQKFKPWEPPVTAVIPEATFLDPTRELAANSEQAAMAYNAATQSANSKAARSAASTYQGQAMRNAADILGRYNNQNIQIANQANQTAANITNQVLQGQRERAKSLNSDMFNANRLYQGELNQLSDEFVKRAYQKEADVRNREWANASLPPYKQFDSRGKLVFDRGAEQAYIDKMLAKGPGGTKGVGQYKSIYQNYIDQGYSPDDAKEYAMDDYNDMYRASLGIGSRTKSSTKQGKTTTTTSGPTKSKMGGFTSAQLRKFIESKIG